MFELFHQCFTTGRIPVRNRKYAMRNRKCHNTPSGVFSPEVVMCACATGTFCITTRVVVQVPWLPVTEGVERWDLFTGSWLQYYTTYPKTTNCICNYENKRGR
jgi:hypothetical protein